MLFSNKNQNSMHPARDQFPKLIRFDKKTFRDYYLHRRGLPEAVGLTSTSNEVNRQVGSSMLLAIFFAFMLFNQIQLKPNLNVAVPVEYPSADEKEGCHLQDSSPVCV